MKKRKPSGKRHWRRSWSADEQHALLQLRLLDFAPSDVIEKLTQQFGAERTGYARRLKGRSQLSCYLEWIDAQDLWYSPLWRQCLSIRHSHPEALAPIDVFPQDWRTKLTEQAAQPRSELGVTRLTMSTLTKAVQSHIPEAVGNTALLVCLALYLRAEYNRDQELMDDLKTPFCRTGLFERIVNVCTRKTSPYRPPQGSKRFRALLNCSAMSSSASVGEVTYLLSVLDSWGLGVVPESVKVRLIGFWHRALALHEVKGGPQILPWPDLGKLSNHLSLSGLREPISGLVDRNKLEHKMAKRAVRLYFALSMEEYQRLGGPADRFVFLAAKMLEERSHDTFELCREQISEFRLIALAAYVEAREHDAQKRAYVKQVEPFLNSLAADPLLNCALHSEVFAGPRRLILPLSKGRQPEEAIGYTTAFVVHRMRNKRGKRVTLKTISIFLDALFQGATPQFTSKRLVDTHDRYCQKPRFREILKTY